MTNNLYTDLPENIPDELLTTLLKAANIRIERIVSHGHASPDGFWYDQEEHEWVIRTDRCSETSIRRQNCGNEVR